MIMKKFTELAFTLFAICVLSSCSSSKSTALVSTPGGSTVDSSDSPWGVKLQLTDSQILAQKKPATRAWGDATNHKLSFATAYAEGQARAKMARAIKASVTTATREADLAWEKYAGNDTMGNTGVDEGSKSDGFVTQIAEAIVENAVIINTDQFMQPNRQYHVFVCLEYQGEASAMSSAITEQIKQQVPDEERLKMEYQFEQFQKKVEEELNKMRAE